MKSAAFLLFVVMLTACDSSGEPATCSVFVQLADAPITLSVGDSTRVAALVDGTGLCPGLNRRVDWSVTVPIVSLRAVDDTTIQVKGLSAGTTRLVARPLVNLSARDSVQLTVVP